MLKMDRRLYTAVGTRINELIGNMIGNVLQTDKIPMYSSNEYVLFSYVFEGNKFMYLNIKDYGSSITIEIEHSTTGIKEIKNNVDMNNLKNILYSMHQKIEVKIGSHAISDAIITSLEYYSKKGYTLSDFII